MNLQSTIDLNFKDFLQWWGKELAFLVPNQVKQLLSDRTGNLIFTIENAGFNVSFIRDGSVKGPTFNLHIDSGDIEAYQYLKQRYPDIENADCILRLNDDHAISKILYLPEAVLENLQQVISFELDRLTPFKSEQVYFTATSLGKTGHGQVQVLLVLTPQNVIDDQLAFLSAWNVQPIRIEYTQLNEKFPEIVGEYNLLPELYRPVPNKLALLVHWLLNFTIFFLFLAVMVYPIWQEVNEVEILKNQIKSLEKDTRIVDEQLFDIEALQDETKRLISIKEESPELVEILNELSRILKDDTWLTNLQYADKHLQIQGQSPMASALIGVLEDNPYFSKVSFVSPLTQDKGTGLERFQISMDVNPKSSLENQTKTSQDADVSKQSGASAPSVEKH